jgi:inner membrane protein
MPSPLGHALGGLAAGWLVAGPGRPFRRRDLADAAVFIGVALAPDLDLLFGGHRGPTHGVGSAAVAGLVAYLATRRGTFALATAAAYASHILLDWLGSDSTAPIGVMALWPLSHEHHASALRVFHAVSRRYWLPDFWFLTVRAVVRELLILLPIVALVVYFRRSGLGDRRSD